MLRNKFVNLLNVEHEKQCSLKLTVIQKLVLSLVEYLLSSVYFCYAAFLYLLVKGDFYNKYEGLYATITLIAVYRFCGVVAKNVCEHFENYPQKTCRIILALFTILLVTSVLLCSIVLNSTFHILCYGIAGGISASFISTQIRVHLEENHNVNIKVYESILQISRALSMMTMPLFVMLLSKKYSVYETLFIFSAVLINIAPLSFILLKKKEVRKPFGMRFHATSGNLLEETELTTRERRSSSSSKSTSVSSQIEENPKETKTDFEEDNASLNSVSVKSDKEEDSSSESSDEDEVAETNKEVKMWSPIQDYYKMFGVCIMPKITEESESVNWGSLNDINLKRISMISAKLEEINQQEKESTENYSISKIESVEDLDKLDLEEAKEEVTKPEDFSKISFLKKDMKTVKNPSCCCSIYRKYVWHRRLRRLKDVCLDYFFDPLFKSLRTSSFYSCLISKTVLGLISTCFITLTPLVVSEMCGDMFKYWDNILVNQEIILQSYIAFSWIFFLVTVPIIINMSNYKFRIFFIIGLITLSASMIMLSKNFSNDLIIGTCVLYGFGFGVTSFCENIVYREYLGVKDWKKTEGTLNSLSGFFVILIYFIIFNCVQPELKALIKMAFVSYLTLALMWIIVPIFKTICVYFRHNFKYRKEQYFFA